MEFHYTLQSKDYWSYQKHVRLYSIKLSRIYRLMYIFYTIVFFILFTISAWNVESVNSLNIAYALFQGFFWSVIVAPIVFKSTYYLKSRSARLVLEKNHFFGDRNIALNKKGLTITSSYNNEVSFYYWKDFIRVYQDGSHYFLYSTDKQAIIIPKSSSKLHTQLQSHVKIQSSQVNKKGYFSKIRIILLILYLLLFISSRYENWTDPLNPIQKETEELFIDFNDASSNLQIKQSVTQEKIDRLYDRLKSVPETKENLYQKLKISSWIQEAEKQLYKELPPEQTEFLVVKVNTGK